MTMLHYQVSASSHKDNRNDSLDHRKPRLWLINNSQASVTDQRLHDARPGSMANGSAQEETSPAMSTGGN